MLYLQTFGGVALDRDGRPGAGAAGQRVRLALLAFIATAGEKGVSRDRITALFWPDSDSERAHGSLKQAFFSLRRDAGEHELTLGTVMLRLNPEAIRSDVGDFQSAIAAKDWEAAVSHYTGVFLEGIHLPGNAEFERWLDRERARLSQDHAAALENLAKDAEAKGNFAGAVLWWRKLAATDMLSSRIARGYIRSLALSGDREAAVKYAHLYETMVRSELETEPDPGVMQLAEELRAALHESPRDNGAVVSPVTAVPRVETAAQEAAGSLLPQKRTRRHVGAWLTSGVFAAAAGGYMLMFGAGASSGGLEADDQILVGDFDARSHKSQDSVYARALSDALRTALGDSRAVIVVSRAEVDQALELMKLPVTTRLSDQIVQDLAARNGWEGILSGALTPVGKGYLLSAQLTTTRGRELATFTDTASSEDLLIGAMSRLSTSLRGKIGESAAALDSVRPLEQVTTRSFRALVLFSQSWWAMRAGERRDRIVTLVREAIAADSTFAMAHRFLGILLYNSDSTREGIRELRRAELFSDHLTESERLSVLSTLHMVIRDYPRSVDEAERVLELNPKSLYAINQLGILDNLLERWDHGREIARKRWVLDKSHSFLPDAVTYEGHTAEGLALARQFFNRYKDSADSRIAISFRQELAALHAAAFDYDSAEYYATPRGKSDGGDPDRLAVIQLARGQIRKAFVTWGVRARGAEGERASSRFSAITESSAAVATSLLSGDRAAASRRLDAVLIDTAYHQGDAADRLIGTVLALALAGRAADAHRELAAIERATDADVRAARNHDLALARGAVALAENRIPEAIAAFDRASATMTISAELVRVTPLAWLGRAYEAAGRPDSAIVVYERYLSTGDPDRLFADAIWRAVILRSLGEMYAQRGDTARAVKYLQQFVALWKNADRELQPQVEAAQRRIAEVRGPP